MISKLKIRKRLLWLVIFLNLFFFGMCTYAYLMWSEYLTNISSQLGLGYSFYSLKILGSSTLSYDEQIDLYNRGYFYKNPNPKHIEQNSEKHSEPKKSKRNSGNDKITYATRGNPRFQSTSTILGLDDHQFLCFPNDNLTICAKKTSVFKRRLMAQLNNVLNDESNVLKMGNSKNPYNVTYNGTKEDFRGKSQTDVLCEFKRTPLRTLKRSDFKSYDSQRSMWPRRGLFENKEFNSCVVVASSGSLRGSNLGKFIDSHEIVLRFNHAPTSEFETDVGHKTTIRVVNSQVVTKPEFNFLNSNVYKNITVVTWDPSNYTSTMRAWIKSPEFNLFPKVFQYRRQVPKAKLYVLNPFDIWRVWDFLQRNSQSRLRKNPPSSGFLGLKLLLPICNFVDVVEYIPSTRATRRCHYYDLNENPDCTFGVWHPLAAEKLLAYHLNSASDYEVFQKGFVRIRGFRHSEC